MNTFLLELRSEEIPARMQAGARADLEKLFRKEMDAAGVALGELTVWSTPRRLALIARGLPEGTAAVSEELKGPKVAAPPQALEGFLRKTGLTQDQLIERDGVYFAVTEKPGRATRDVLAEAIPAIIRAFPWPKSQRWGAVSLSTESLRWVRPLSGIVALLGEELVECAVGDVASGFATKGHRFHCPGDITIGSAADYQEKLRACHVIVDHEERQDLIRSKAREAAEAAGLTLVADEGLVIENAGLTEWPVPLLGRFDEAFLEVPPEVIQLTARTNQKYFVCHSSPERGGGPRSGGGAQAGAPDAAKSRSPHVPLHHPADGPPPRAGEEPSLANAFVCTANIAAADGGEAIVAGNRKVLAARLSDARFFWEQDRKVPLAAQAKKLERITFHEKLGTVADKVERVAKLARWLVEEGIVKSSPERGGGRPEGTDGGAETSPADAALADSTRPLRPSGAPPRSGEDLADVAQLADLAEQAARLCKADLVTEMVGEFPELQGLMGGYYARAEGLDPQVADAIRDHYKPVGQGDDVPTAPVTVAVSLADKLDTLVGFFAISEKPTGSKDPFALRRATLGVLSILQRNQIRFNLNQATRPVAKLLTKHIASQELTRTGQSIDDADEWYQASLSDRPFVIEGEAVWRSNENGVGRMHYAVQLGAVFRWIQAIHDTLTEGLAELPEFFADRLKVQQREAGVRHDLIDAVFALGGEDDLVRLLARVRALQAFVGTEDGTNLLAGYKRAANILKKEKPLPFRGGEEPRSGGGVGSVDLAPRQLDMPHPNPSPEGEGLQKPLSYTPEPAEKALIDALDLAAPLATAAVAEERFADAMAALASLRSAVDAFFEQVTVNDADDQKRQARLALLARFRDAVHGVADFSKIEG